MSNTIDIKEVEKFTAMADEWWSATGKFKPLHKFNPCRISYIREKLINHFSSPYWVCLSVAEPGSSSIYLIASSRQDVRRVCHKPVMSSNSETLICNGTPLFITKLPSTQVWVTCSRPAT